MKIYCRATCIAGEIHSKPCSDWDGPITKPRPKPQDEEFISEKEFKV
jgi:hypothetical protein